MAAPWKFSDSDSVMITPRQLERLNVDGGHDRPPSFDDIFRRPAWHADANCLEHPDLDFVDADRDAKAKAEALQVCGRCLVMSTCRAYALDDPSLVGIWGGTDSAARRAMRRARGES